MKLEELEGLNRDQWFDELKGKCKSRADLNLCFGILVLVLIIIALLSRLGYSDINRIDIVPFVGFIALGCLMAFLTWNNYRFHKRADSLNTPDQLLHMYEKTVQNNNRCWLAFALLIACEEIIKAHFNGQYFWLKLGILLIAIIVAIVLYKKELINQRDKQIIRALRELTEEE